ncbi:ATP-dependent RNA helicase DDX24 [Latimeria chalumnae]|uniref:ATP-dependent RNA helicase n=1 Tax=Latimeria chalumnae TaxID=7897 RepID=H3AB20_LATCH
MKMKKAKKVFFKSPAKTQQQGIKVLGKWKPVAIDPSVFADEEVAGLMTCFEELVDYELIDSSKIVEKNTKKRKGSISEEESSPKRKKGNTDGELETKKAAKKKKWKNKKIVQENVELKELSADLSEVNEGLGEQNDAAVEDLVIPETSQKKKKKKKKKKKRNAVSSQKQEVQHFKSCKKVKNWTTAALSSSADQAADVSAWKDLFVPEPVLRALRSLGFSAPTPIQALALPPAIRDKMDILGAAETGSGKTLSFGIPMIHSILEWQKAKKVSTDTEDKTQNSGTETPEDANDFLIEDKPVVESDNALPAAGEDGNDSLNLGCGEVQENVECNIVFGKTAKKIVTFDENRPLLGLVLTPTRELAVQVKHHIDAVAKFTGIKTAIVVGGMASQKQERVLNHRPEIVIATPGRLWELIKERHPHLSNLKHLRCLVVDEADRMVEKGHFAELSLLLEMLNDCQYNPDRQTFVFSATLTMVYEAPQRVLQKKSAKKIDKKTKLEILMEKTGIKGKPKVIDLTRKEATVETLTETRIQCEIEEKDFYLYYFLLQYPGRTMVFANSIDCIKRLQSLLSILDCNPLPLHANMHQKQRLKNLERFAERESCILLTTDVAARGLDIPNVQHVIHYQVPRTCETYVHRSGRTARATKEGLSLLLIGPDDMMNFKKIYRTLGKDEDLPLFPVEMKCMATIKERVKLARSIEKIEYHNSKAKQHNSWFQQAAEALELELDDDVLIGGRQEEHEEKQRQKMLKSMKKQLKYLLSQAVFKNVMKTKYPTQLGKLMLPELPAGNVESALNTIIRKTKKEQLKKS